MIRYDSAGISNLLKVHLKFHGTRAGSGRHPDSKVCLLAGSMSWCTHILSNMKTIIAEAGRDIALLAKHSRRSGHSETTPHSGHSGLRVVSIPNAATAERHEYRQSCPKPRIDTVSKQQGPLVNVKITLSQTMSHLWTRTNVKKPGPPSMRLQLQPHVISVLNKSFMRKLGSGE